jgi:1-acyl-sn-glycerol-3-phosphate acyltransferase
VGDEREYGKLYPVARGLIRPVMHALWRMNVTGLHNVPEDGPAIFCPNHISFFDSLVLPVVLPRRISYVGKAEYMDSWKTKHLFPAIGMIPIDREGGNASQRALDTATRVLERGELFGIYPEGTRSRDGRLHRGHTGPARLALRTGAPLIPVGLRGTDRIQPAGAAVPQPFRSCQVNIGQPIDVTRYRDRPDDRIVLRQLIDEVMYEIRKLSGQEYVDVYANKRDDAEPEASEVAAPVAEPAEPVEPAEVAASNGHPAPEPEPEPEPARERVLVSVGGGRDIEVHHDVDERRSSADVLSKWWS